MKMSDSELEAEQLSARFQGINQAEFARLNAVPGGKSMISQHVNGRRPISVEAAIAYARGFQCSIEDISPRISNTLAGALPYLNTPLQDAFEDWRLQASPRSLAVIDMLRIAAQRNALTDADWLLIEQLAQRFAK